MTIVQTVTRTTEEDVLRDWFAGQTTALDFMTLPRRQASLPPRTAVNVRLGC